jgi:hypothetical protein
MTDYQVKRLGQRLLRKHGLSDWTLYTKPLYGNSTVLASCYHRRKEIVIYTEWTNSRRELQESILHEIAHALAGPKSGHGPRWQRKARKLGVRECEAYARAYSGLAK